MKAECPGIMLYIYCRTCHASDGIRSRPGFTALPECSAAKLTKGTLPSVLTVLLSYQFCIKFMLLRIPRELH